MSTLIVVNNPREWPLRVPGVEVVPAREYLTSPAYSNLRGAKVYNLSRSYRYQSLGYYVSLIAAARGHRPLPSAGTIQDMKTQAIVRIASEELQELIDWSLGPLRSEHFTLSVYFGRSLAQRYARLALAIFNLFQAPLLRAEFERRADGWTITDIGPIAAREIPEGHQTFVVETASKYFRGRRPRRRRTPAARYELAILHEPGEADAPSNAKALRHFTAAAEELGLATELVTRDDYARLAEFDALFIRVTTRVNHYSYRFARRASALGLIVMDDPESIVRCGNKVYLAELMARHRITTPKTLVVHRGNIDTVIPAIGLPVVLKQPDSAFSQGVVRADDEAALRRSLDDLLDRSDLVIAQSFLPTPFDWRIGILHRQPLYACRYYMARRHWQVVKRDLSGRKTFEGAADVLPIAEVPKTVVRTALRAANLIGDGFYGVDLKQIGRRCYVIEVNDNPSIDAGVEDKVLKDDLYAAVMRAFVERLDRQRLHKS